MYICTCTYIHNYICFFTAAKMWCLARLLPLIIGDVVPEDDERWKLFLQLLTIIDYVFAPKTTSEIVAYVRVLIQYHHTKFTLLYPDCSVIPKMHYMVHIGWKGMCMRLHSVVWEYYDIITLDVAL